MPSPLLLKLQSAGSLSPEDCALLEDAFGDIRTVPMRRDIVREGECPEYVHLIVEGWACRYQMLNTGARQITAFMLPGDLCDTHIALFGQMDHSIGALTEAKVARVPRARMLELFDRPSISRAFWWGSLVDEATLRAWIVNLGRRAAPDRIAHLLCELHARLQHVGLANDHEFDLPLTQEELSDALGLTSVHVNRTLKKLRELGLLTHKRQTIVISDVPALRALAGFDANYLHFTTAGKEQVVAAEAVSTSRPAPLQPTGEQAETNP